MKSNRIPVLVCIAVLSGAALFILVSQITGMTNQNVVVDVSTLLSALIAVIALIYSIITYISIDSVNVISRLDGNILENEGYRTNLYRLIRDLQVWKGRNKQDAPFSKESFIDLLAEPYQRGIKSGSQFADCIQQTIDYLALIPFILPSDRSDTDNHRIEEKINNLLELIERRVRKFEKVNAGSSILMKESLYLIEAVIGQQFENHFKSGQLQKRVPMPAVRGTMLKNPISKVVYYNYLGLFYMHKAFSLVFGDRNYDPLIEEVADVCERKVNDKTVVVDYLELAEKQFSAALDVIGDDVMWNAFIHYNLARSRFLKLCLSGLKFYTPTLFDKAIDWRRRLNVFIDEVLVDSEAGLEVHFFKDAFWVQELLAWLYKYSSEIATGTFHDSDSFRSIMASAKKVIDEKKDFGRLARRYDDINSHLEKVAG